MLEGFLIFTATVSATAATGVFMIYLMAWVQQKRRRGK